MFISIYQDGREGREGWGKGGIRERGGMRKGRDRVKRGVYDKEDEERNRKEGGMI